MYRHRISETILSPKTNLKTLLTAPTNPLHFSYQYTFLIRQQFKECRTFKSVSRQLEILFKNGRFFKIFQESLVPERRPKSVLKVWAHQCECVFAQKLRRCHQMFCLYTTMWEERALKEFIKRMRITVTKRSKDLVLAAVGVSAYNWETNRISEDDMKKHLNELEYINKLKEHTICMACDPTNRAKFQDEKPICECGTLRKSNPSKYDDWETFIQEKDLVVWRRLHPSGFYEYKVYGSYNDVYAEDFLNVQIDIDYRRTWDKTAVSLELAETDQIPDSNSDVIYWEMLWPKLFVNRDYVFNRRYLVFDESKTIVIYSKSTEHSAFPRHPEKYRIEDYWSCMVIKPYADMQQPGVEFSLTYYDNPGINIPASVTTWVAMRAMPDFLGRLRAASKKYRQYCMDEGTSRACTIIQKETVPEMREDKRREVLEYCALMREQFRAHLEEKRSKRGRKGGDGSEGVSTKHNRDTESAADVNTAPTSTAIQKESSSYWKYLHPMYYFH